VTTTVGAAVEAMLRESHLAAGHELPELARRHVAAFGGVDVMCYLADLQQAVLVPFVGADGPDSGEHLEPLPIDSTLAGRAFQRVQILVQHGGSGGATAWFPLLDGAERVGMMAVSLADSGDDVANGRRGDHLRCLASLLAELIVAKTMYGDTIVRLRRQAQMGLAAEMQWSLLPPLTFACRDVTVAAALEPAYEVGGDTIDYAVDAGIARVAVLDGMGHGLGSARVAALAVAAYRHARRALRPLVETCLAMDSALVDNFGGTSFTTAVLAELETRTGVLKWVNAGHPEPLLLRHGRLVKTLHVAPRPPLGIDLANLGVSAEPAIGTEHLEPGDCVLLYTDGVVEARSPDGEFFGDQRLADLVLSSMASGLPPPETMRRVVRAILAHQQGRLTDDASLVLIQWPTADPATLLP
jgi:serine phosphatase RsbU (regulator of sigma subunit)